MPENSTPSASDTGSTGSAPNGSQPHPTMFERWSRLRMGHEAVMLQDAQEVLAQSRKTVAAHHKANGLDGPDDMGTINLGDTTIYNAQQPQAPAKPGLSGLAKAGIAVAAAAALGGGVGLPLALPSIIDALKPAVQPASPSIDTDTDTVFDLFIGAPKGN